jgi:RNA polymerase sigma factor (sigma-70 family)
MVRQTAYSRRQALVSGKDIKGLFLAHRREIQAFLTRKLGNLDLAADLTQETFIRYAQQTGSGTGPVIEERSYLFRTANNLAIDYIRMERRRQTTLAPHESLAEHAEDAPGLDRAYEAKQELAQLQAIIAELPLLTRQCFLLVRAEEMTYAEAAAVLDVSSSTVQKHLSRAVRHVIQRLKS